PDNNLGQENTNVVHAHSAAATTFRLRNDTRERQRYRFQVDTYVLPRRAPCDQAESPRRRERHRRRPGFIEQIPVQHDPARYPVPRGWSVTLTPESPVLEPGEEITIGVEIEPPAAFTGRQAFNINAATQRGVAGGVTIYVERE